MIYHHLASHFGTHPGSECVLALLDHFGVQGPNGEHDMLVLQVVGPHLKAMFCEEPTVIQQSMKPLIHQVTLGTSFLHHCGVIHAGQSNNFSIGYMNLWYGLDLHQGNVALEILSLDGKSEESAMTTLGMPNCVPVFARDQQHHTDSLPKYLVIPGSLTDCVEQDDTVVLTKFVHNS